MQVHQDDRQKTAFGTQRMGSTSGQWSRMGLSGAYGIFQRLMNHYLLCYLDDIINYRNTCGKHLEHIHRVLQVFWGKKLYAKGSKCLCMLPSDLPRVHGWLRGCG
jgi:hypothetical protein